MPHSARGTESGSCTHATSLLDICTNIPTSLAGSPPQTPCLNCIQLKSMSLPFPPSLTNLCQESVNSLSNPAEPSHGRDVLQQLPHALPHVPHTPGQRGRPGSAKPHHTMAITTCTLPHWVHNTIHKPSTHREILLYLKEKSE